MMGGALSFDFQVGIKCLPQKFPVGGGGRGANPKEKSTMKEPYTTKKSMFLLCGWLETLTPGRPPPRKCLVQVGAHLGRAAGRERLWRHQRTDLKKTATNSCCCDEGPIQPRARFGLYVSLQLCCGDICLGLI
jgi:hypothetical protein